MYEEAMKGVRHLLVQKSVPNGLVFVGESYSGQKGSFSPKMDHLVCGTSYIIINLTDSYCVLCLLCILMVRRCRNS